MLQPGLWRTAVQGQGLDLLLLLLGWQLHEHHGQHAANQLLAQLAAVRLAFWRLAVNEVLGRAPCLSVTCSWGV